MLESAELFILFAEMCADPNCFRDQLEFYGKIHTIQGKSARRAQIQNDTFYAHHYFCALLVASYFPACNYQYNSSTTSSS